jgi:hypothetical protein
MAHRYPLPATNRSLGGNALADRAKSAGPYMRRHIDAPFIAIAVFCIVYFAGQLAVAAVS